MVKETAGTADDELFWRREEERRRDLGQPCCTLSNTCWALVGAPSSACVVIHGERDCADSFYRHLGANLTNLFCTDLSERHFVTGTTLAPLEDLLGRIAGILSPPLVVVLGSCPLEITGADFAPAVGRISARTGVPMIALRTHGLGLATVAECQDALCAAVVELACEGEPDPHLVNLIGLPPCAALEEPREALAALGLGLNGAFPNGPVEGWREMARAARSFVVDPGSFPRMVTALSGRGSAVTEIPLPIGLDACDAFYRAIAAGCGRAGALDGMVLDHRARIARSLERTRELAAGVRLALCIRMLRSHRMDQIAYDGLSELDLLVSAGFEIEILLQGPPEDAPRAAFAAALGSRGLADIPLRVFDGPWLLGERLSEGGFGIAVMSDVVRDLVEGVGVRVIPSGSFRPFFSGMEANLDLLSGAVARPR